jgi:hypothetical protein
MEDESNRREPNHDEDNLRVKSYDVLCEGGAPRMTSQTSMKPDEEESLASQSSPFAFQKSVT